MRKLLTALAGAAVLVAVVLVAVGGGSGDEPESAVTSAGEATSQLEGAPPELASLHEQANQLLDGGADAFRQRLAELRGRPVVVNKWASWCGPCRQEFPHFQRQAVERGKQVAFIGVNSNDNDEAAKEFLERFPVPFPSYKDPDLEVAAVFKGVQAFPSTAFYDSDGKLAYLKQGVYPREADLVEDLERYAK